MHHSVVKLLISSMSCDGESKISKAVFFARLYLTNHTSTMDVNGERKPVSKYAKESGFGRSIFDWSLKKHTDLHDGKGMCMAREKKRKE